MQGSVNAPTNLEQLTLVLSPSVRPLPFMTARFILDSADSLHLCVSFLPPPASLQTYRGLGRYNDVLFVFALAVSVRVRSSAWPPTVASKDVLLRWTYPGFFYHYLSSPKFVFSTFFQSFHKSVYMLMLGTHTQ